jgi:hypothetical protein
MPTRTSAPSPGQCVALLGGPAVTVAALEGIGVSRAMAARRCRPGGPWQRAATGIVVLHNGPLSRDDLRSAALAIGGAGAMLTGPDGLRASGMRRSPEPVGPVHVLVPADRQRTAQGLVVLERTTRLPHPVAGRWPCAPVARAVLDTARRCSDRDVVRATIAEVVQRGRATPAQLAAELDAGSGRGAALVRSVLEEVGAGVRSAAEGSARRLLRRSPVLRGALWNPTLYDARDRFVAVADAWLDDVAMAWEIDSYEWHLSPADYEATLARRSRMTAAGIVVVHHTPRRIRTDERGVLAELEGAYEQCRTRPRPAVRAVPAPGIAPVPPERMPHSSR